MLSVTNLEEIAGLLLQVPDIVRLQEERSPDFPGRTRAWLGGLEEVFTGNRLYQAGLIAVLRSRIAAAEQGHVPPGVQTEGLTTRSKVVAAAAIQAMSEGTRIASAIMAENDARLSESERVANQIAAIAGSRELIPPRVGTASNSEYLRAVRETLAEHGDLDGAMIHLQGLVGARDALILLDRALGTDVRLKG